MLSGSYGSIVSGWLKSFESAITAADSSALVELFVEDSHWRDLFVFTWTITPRNGRDEVVRSLMAALPPARPRNFRIAENRTAPRPVSRSGEAVIEAIFEFETDVARGAGILRLPVNNPEQAWMISTSLHEIKGREWPIDDNRPTGQHDRLFGGDTKATRHARELEYADRQPSVLIVGGGHNGISTGAQLRMLGVDALVIERLPNVGDVWRNRYSSLALHNKIHLNHLPFMKYPETWPQFLTKDALGDWIESYAKAMDVNVWTSSEFVGARWDEERKVWAATVRCADGTERILHPRHVLMANGGIVGRPHMPDFPGLGDFKGEVAHSHSYVSGEGYRGKKVLIVGIGNTAHDIAQDLHGYGVDVAMIQRSSITVFSVEAVTLNHALYYKGDTPLEDCDLIATSPTYPVALKGYQLNVQKMLEVDKELLDGLKARGMKLDIGEDGGGHQMKIRKQHGGYYLNVGCSDLIVSGEVGLIQTDNVDRFVENGLRMKDGSVREADVVITATGYESPTKEVARLFGDGVADRIGPIWGLDPKDHELQNMYKPTAQQGLWFVAGGFAQGRVWTRFIALQIAAREAGIVTDPIKSCP
ncbi:putative oxidoreductase CzcO-like (plasmid) [Sphingobium sp. EP60837]|nr:putative oxidoreductase CzcO-like [Sphingobium sp. EP60837]